MLGATPAEPDEKSDPVRARPSLRAHFHGCAGEKAGKRKKEGKKKGQTFEGTRRRRRRLLAGFRRTRGHARLIFPMRFAARSTSISSGRELVTSRERGSRQKEGVTGKGTSEFMTVVNMLILRGHPYR